jgi:hypothetical protein
MNKQELLQALNGDAVSYGLKPINLRQLNDWIDGGLVGKSQAIGNKRGENPTWYLSQDAISRARAIVTNISFGASRKTEHRIFLWVSGFEFPIIDIRKSFKNEFRRFVRRQRRLTDWKYDHRDQHQPEKIVKYSRQLPELDLILQQLRFDLPKAALMQFASEVHFGKSLSGGLPALATHLAQKYKIQPEALLGQLSEFSMEGLLGDQEEIDESAIELLKSASEADFQIGRLKTKAFIEKIDLLPTLGNFGDPNLANFTEAMKSATNSVRGPNWLISFLASAIVAAVKSRK